MVRNVDIGELAKQIEKEGMSEWLKHELVAAFREARKNKIKTYNEHQYEVNWMQNILKLRDAIMERTYKPSSSLSFIIYDPMIREIFAAPFVDRIVHHFLYAMQAGWWDRRFIHDSYSCRDNKGTLYGILRVQKMMRKAQELSGEECYVIKLDIKGYFMSLPRQKLYEKIKWGLDRQFDMYLDQKGARELKKVCKFLWHQILMDDPVQKSRRRGSLENWRDLPPEKSLYERDPGEGIVIGNLTSQLISNIYLDALDRYVKYDRGYKWYGRYVDDFIIIVPKSQYEQALKDIRKIERFLRIELQLILHPKKRYIQNVKHGVNFLGARIYPRKLYPSNRLQSKFRQAVKKFVESGGERGRESMGSYMGLLKHLNADRFVARVFDEYGLDFNLYLESKADQRRDFETIMTEMVKDLEM